MSHYEAVGSIETGSHKNNRANEAFQEEDSQRVLLIVLHTIGNYLIPPVTETTGRLFEDDASDFIKIFRAIIGSSFLVAIIFFPLLIPGFYKLLKQKSSTVNVRHRIVTLIRQIPKRLSQLVSYLKCKREKTPPLKLLLYFIFFKIKYSKSIFCNVFFCFYFGCLVIHLQNTAHFWPSRNEIFSSASQRKDEHRSLTLILIVSRRNISAQPIPYRDFEQLENILMQFFNLLFSSWRRARLQ